MNTTTEPAPTGQPMLSADQVCDLVGISKRTFWRLSSRPDFPSRVRINRKVVLWSAASIQSWLDSTRM